MKKAIIYLFALLSLGACSQLGDPDEGTGRPDRIEMTFRVNVPGYSSVTRADNNLLSDLYLMVFDSNGLYLERNVATVLTGTAEGTGTFTASIPSNAGYIHFIANYGYQEWTFIREQDLLQKDEREIVPQLYSNKLIFWGRNEVDPSSLSAVDVTLYRNQAKVTLEKEAAVTNFDIDGFALCNYADIGTVAPFIPNTAPTPFVISDSNTTLPLVTLTKSSQNEDNCDMEDKYMFENENYFNDQCYIILQGRLDGGDPLFYKIQFLDPDKQPYKIIRNYRYRVVIRSFSGAAKGSSTFADAKNAEPSNNIYAEILRESPSISDGNGNSLSVNGIDFFFVQGGTLNITAEYITGGQVDNSQITGSILEDQGNILGGQLSNDMNGNFTANVAGVLAGQKTATIQIKAGGLSRIITVTSTELYRFDPAGITPDPYTSIDQQLTLSFTIPDEIPASLFPLNVAITTTNLYPTDPNKDLGVQYYPGGTFKYIYQAWSSGDVNLQFKTGLENSDETITLENEYFHTSSIVLSSRYFSGAAVNTNNLVAYGKDNAADLTFGLAAGTGLQVTYPVTVLITTANLTTTDASWEAEPGGNGYRKTFLSDPGTVTVPFTSKTEVSYEDIILSADGFRKTTVSFDNYLASNVTGLTNTIYISSGGRLYNINRATVTSHNTDAVASFRTTNNSRYTITVKQGSRLSDAVTFTYSGYYGSYTVEQLLTAPQILLQ